ncbi:MAG: hypothetical protein AAF449_14480 [Myxococcota bacterium]
MKRPNKKVIASLVEQAQDVVESALTNKLLGKTTGNSQFANLAGICQSASCPEEIESWLRYQVGRSLWKNDFYRQSTEALKNAVGDQADSDTKLAAWRLFAVYMAREYRYQNALAGGNPQ